jgi:hypothetical protein
MFCKSTTVAAKLAAVDDSNMVGNPSSTLNCFRILEIPWVAVKECPAIWKKFQFSPDSGSA